MSAAGNDGTVSEVDTYSSDEVSEMKLLQTIYCLINTLFYGCVLSMYQLIKLFIVKFYNIIKTYKCKENCPHTTVNKYKMYIQRDLNTSIHCTSFCFLLTVAS